MVKRALFLVFLLSAGCGYVVASGRVDVPGLSVAPGLPEAPEPPPVPPARPPDIYTVPLGARDQDWVCAEALESVGAKPCVRVREFRLFVLSLKA